MRIKLKKGFQRKLILLAKNKNNFTWEMLAKELGISRDYLVNEIAKEKRTLDKKIYQKLCNLSKKKFNKHIKEKLKDNWGKSKGGKSTTKKPKLLIDKTSKELAELVGIILGDGNIWCKGGGYYYLRICGDSEKDKEYFINYIK